MRFRGDKNQVLKTLQKVQNAVSSKNTMPILSNMLLEAEKDGVRITATDLDMGISAIVSVKPDVEGAITIPAKKFLDIIKELPDSGDISISSKKKSMNIKKMEKFCS